MTRFIYHLTAVFLAKIAKNFHQLDLHSDTRNKQAFDERPRPSQAKLKRYSIAQQGCRAP